MLENKRPKFDQVKQSSEVSEDQRGKFIIKDLNDDRLMNASSFEHEAYSAEWIALIPMRVTTDLSLHHHTDI
nr:3040_t:CDS:2 [Entrophospora candida]